MNPATPAPPALPPEPPGDELGALAAMRVDGLIDDGRWRELQARHGATLDRVHAEHLAIARALGSLPRGSAGDLAGTIIRSLPLQAAAPARTPWSWWPVLLSAAGLGLAVGLVLIENPPPPRQPVSTLAQPLSVVKVTGPVQGPGGPAPGSPALGAGEAVARRDRTAEDAAQAPGVYLLKQEQAAAAPSGAPPGNLRGSERETPAPSEEVARLLGAGTQGQIQDVDGHAAGAPGSPSAPAAPAPSAAPAAAAAPPAAPLGSDTLVAEAGPGAGGGPRRERRVFNQSVEQPSPAAAEMSNATPAGPAPAAGRAAPQAAAASAAALADEPAPAAAEAGAPGAMAPGAGLPAPAAAAPLVALEQRQEPADKGRPDQDAAGAVPVAQTLPTSSQPGEDARAKYGGLPANAAIPPAPQRELTLTLVPSPGGWQATITVWNPGPGHLVVPAGALDLLGLDAQLQPCWHCPASLPRHDLDLELHGRASETLSLTGTDVPPGQVLALELRSGGLTSAPVRLRTP